VYQNDGCRQLVCKWTLVFIVTRMAVMSLTFYLSRAIGAMDASVPSMPLHMGFARRSKILQQRPSIQERQELYAL